MNIVVRCDGGADVGMGHVVRSIALADELRGAHGCAVAFAMRGPAGAGVAAVHDAGYAVDVLGDDENGPGVLGRLLAARRAEGLIVDVRDALSRDTLDGIRRTGVMVVTIDDISARRLASDLAFFPPVPQVQEIDWTGFTGRRYSGWEWVVLRKEFEAGGPGRAGGAGGESPAIDVLITMGGSDPAGMTEFAIDALGTLPAPLVVQVVTGPAFPRSVELRDTVARSKHDVRVAAAPASFSALIRNSRVALAAFGMTAYELAACGIPAVHVCLTDDHARSSSAFQSAGITITAGVFGRVAPAAVAQAVATLMRNAALRAEMSARARQLVDGRGARRVADEIVRHLRRRADDDQR